MPINKKRCFVMLAMLLSILLMGQVAPRQPSANRPAEFKLVQEIKYGKVIRDAAFGSLITDNKEFIYPKIILFNKEVAFNNKDSKIIARVELDSAKFPRVVFSPKGRYVGIKVSIPGKVTFSVYNELGEAISNTEVAPGEPEYGGWIYSLNDKDGSFAALFSATQKLVFFDSRGVIKKEINLFKNIDFQMERMTSCTFSDDGKFFLVLTMKKFAGGFDYMPPNENYLYAILFNHEGNELWRQPLEGDAPGSPGGISISSKGKFICVGDVCQGEKGIFSAHFYLFTNKSKLIGKYSVLEPLQPYYPICKFSKDEKFLILANHNRVQLIETGSGKVIWTKQFPWNIDPRKGIVRLIAAVAIADNATTIGLVSHAGDWTRKVIADAWGNQQLDILNSKGELLLNKRISESEKTMIDIESGRFTFVNSNGNQLYLRLQKKFEIFEKLSNKK